MGSFPLKCLNPLPNLVSLWVCDCGSSVVECVSLTVMSMFVCLCWYMCKVYHVLLLSWCAQVKWHQLSCDLGRGRRGTYNGRHVAGAFRTICKTVSFFRWRACCMYAWCVCECVYIIIAPMEFVLTCPTMPGTWTMVC